MIAKTIAYWFRIVRDATKLWLDHNAFSYAGSLAFYTLFSLAPTVIIAVTVIGVVLGEDAAQGEIVANLQGLIGPDAAQAVQNAVSASRLESSGLLPTLLGVGTLLIGATTVFAQMQYSLNNLWGVTANPDRNSLLIFLQKRVLSMAIVVSIGFVLLVSLVLGVALRAAFRYAGGWLPGTEVLLSVGELALSLLVIALFFATIFKILPDVVLRWRDVMVGALVTAILFAIGRYAIAAYLAYTATASTYGAAGSLVLILLWVYYSSLILLFGAALTRTHFEARGHDIVPRNMAVRVRHELLMKGRSGSDPFS
ncbi:MULTISPECIES: YihY/virulence factor BrkB family protein [Halomonadaceae]|uniref:YihY/virulence factor BrkB family protein n=1 Tax=Modicisalibacter zincidurans TaxID=1178777 RepID=A0ABP9RIQ2_9GAMM|nr:YihY/virulence factor BrkB family protein [Halomonas zincidurans]MCD6007037.1 YihY/virulence factor BrkB family protein [Halomonas sp. IOP_31]